MQTDNSFFERFVKKPRMVLIVGKCGDGKSYLTEYLLHYLITKQKHYKFGIYLSGTINKNRKDRDLKWLDERYIFEGYDEAKISAYHKNLKRMQDETGKIMQPNFIVFDDMIGLLNKGKFFTHLTTVYRHTNTDIYILSQYLKASVSNPQIRELSDYCFIFQCGNRQGKKSLYDMIGCNYCEDEQEFYNVFKRATEIDHQCLMYDRNKRNKSEALQGFMANANYKKTNVKFGKRGKTKIQEEAEDE